MTSASSELWNNEAEQIVLASFIRNPQDYWSINDVRLEASDFQMPSNKRLARAIFEVVDEKGQPDVPFVIETLNASGNEEEKSLLSDLASLPVSIPQAHESARIVKSLSTARRLQQVGAAIIDIAKEKRSDYEGAISDAENKLRRLSESLPEPERSPRPSDILRRIRTSGPTDAIPITFSPTLQQLTGGLQRGHLWVIGGFSSVGKSAVACNFAVDALHGGTSKVAIISCEMTQEQYVIRLLAILSGIEQNRIRDNYTIGIEEQKSLIRAMSILSKDNLTVYDTIYRMSEIRSQMKRQKEREGLDVLIVDFIQNVEGSTHDEVKDAREVILECQRLAKELQCTVIVMSQLSNAMAMQDDAEKGKGDYYAFKGSGAIKDASDVAIMLRRARRSQSPILEMEIKKNRSGALGEASLSMDLPTGIIREIEEDE